MKQEMQLHLNVDDAYDESIDDKFTIGFRLQNTAKPSLSQNAVLLNGRDMMKVHTVEKSTCE